MAWELIRAGSGAERHTVYHSDRDHLSGYRLAVRQGSLTPWRWSVFAAEPGRTERTVLVASGPAQTWQEARMWAEANALDLWNDAHPDAEA